MGDTCKTENLKLGPIDLSASSCAKAVSLNP